jgi:hypothetical protein
MQQRLAIQKRKISSSSQARSKWFYTNSRSATVDVREWRRASRGTMIVQSSLNDANGAASP